MNVLSTVYTACQIYIIYKEKIETIKGTKKKERIVLKM